ncbi:MAG: GH39 family glycosyl hydrolase [Planktothrix sp.]|uniref:GH39 family glycosyl hydrolase n=1 Tax=Planktothrix sp. TaxID=3088171 RepID=UPI0038D39430
MALNPLNSLHLSIKQTQFQLKKLLPVLIGLLTLLTVLGIGQFQVLGQQQNTITIDFATQRTGISSMSGFLYGKNATQPPDNMIKPLQPKLWRTSQLDLYSRVIGFGAEFQLILSDTWGYGRPRGWPYDNYTKWEDHVRQVARRNKDKVILWDVWNEPDLRDPFWKGTREQFFETYKRAYQVLRQELGPNVMIGGPSLAKYDQNFITAFLNYCKDNNLEVNFLSWHELNDQDITSIAGRINNARRSFQQNPNYQSLKIQKIYVNEIIGPTAQYRPAEILGYLYYTELGRADGAAKACWDPENKGSGTNNCFNNSLDGLVTPDQSLPRAAWWVYKSYADGFNSRVVSQPDNPKIVALASRANGEQKAQILLGYFEQAFSAPTAGVTLVLKNLQQLNLPNTSGNLTFRIQRIPNSGEQVVKELVTLRQDNIPVNNQVVRLTIPNLQLHEAYLLSIG